MTKNASEAVAAFARALQRKYSTAVEGEPEDQLRAPFEALASALGSLQGYTIVPVGETRLANRGGKPDYGIAVNGLLCGHAELKAPGKGADPAAFTGHDRAQWEKFRQLPNVLYSDGTEWALYRRGELVRSARLDRDPRGAGEQAVSPAAAEAVAGVFRDFFLWEPETPKSAQQLAQYLAPLCRMLRDDVLDALNHHVGPVRSAAADWRRYLFPGIADEQFADAYAQTVTFTLLLARSNGSDTLFLDHAVASLTGSNTMLSRALKVLTDPQVEGHLGASLKMLQRVINSVPTGTMSGGRRDPWLHFYEDFLQEYDPDLRRDAGAYYTPVEVVQAQVKIADDLLTRKFKKRLGFADGGVNVLDPAVGTGTYLLGIIEHAMERVEQEEGRGAVAARASVLASSLYGFEIMVGPYAVAALRVTRLLQDWGAGIPGDGVQVMLNNTLESPHEKIPELPLMYRPIGIEHQRAKRVKETVPILVCIGNPPYDRHQAATKDNKAATGSWVRWGEAKDGRDAILNDFIEPVKKARKGGQLKNLYNLYVYFWRWALWKTFEHELASGPGIVSFITASSFLDGDAFLGMREHLRRECDEIWIIDLGGEGRGTRQDENVFAIKTPVAITITVRYGPAQREKPAKAHYTRLEGTRKGKLETLEQVKSLNDLSFESCASEWAAPFRPVTCGGYFDWPLLTDLMPWQTSGSQLKRTWPIAPDPGVLKKRWERLLAAPDRKEAFKESRDRTVNTDINDLGTNSLLASIKNLETDAPAPRVAGYGYRSFDRQFVFADNRVGDYLRPSLWAADSGQQLYLASLFSNPLGSGPALTVSALVPDLDFFRGSYGAKNILPLFRNTEASSPNIHPELLELLVRRFKHKITPAEYAAYCYCVLAHPAFTNRFHDELGTRGLRVPVTLDPKLFAQAVEVGSELLFLHTYGERFAKGREWPANSIKCLKPVPQDRLPEKPEYDSTKRVIRVESGEFGPVSQAVWDFEVSGLKVVQSWLGYRKRNRAGKKSSPLDEIQPTGWTGEYTTELLKLLNLLARTLEIYPIQKDLLDQILRGPLLKSADLGAVPEAFRKPPKASGLQHDLVD